MHQSLKLAVADANEGLVLVLNRVEDAAESETIGLAAALKCAPAKARLNAEDAREWVAQILRRAAEAPEPELPGLTTALECLLSMDERPAADLIGEMRARPRWTGRVTRALKRAPRRTS